VGLYNGLLSTILGRGGIGFFRWAERLAQGMRCFKELDVSELPPWHSGQCHRATLMQSLALGAAPIGQGIVWSFRFCLKVLGDVF
jgi:hypothetical protein